MLKERKTEWIRVTRQHPCACCARVDWCTVAADGTALCCMRIESPKRLKNGGWLHLLTEPIPKVDLPAKQEPVAPVDAEAIAKAMYRHTEAPAARTRLATSLGVSEGSLDRLRVGVGWDRNKRMSRFYSFPSRDEKARVVGIIRRYEDGAKYTYKGTSNRGCFYARDWAQADGPIFVVEGGSDTAKLYTLGLAAVGRPSCQGGAEIVSVLLKRQYQRACVVVAEADRKPCKDQGCRGCRLCWPGLAGAKDCSQRLTELVGYPVPWILPPGGKDVRAAHGNVLEAARDALGLCGIEGWQL